jgi:hypothetical protein
MTERRTKRSELREEALQMLVESVADRNGARALVLMNEAGRIVAGIGMPNDVMTLARTARQGAWGSLSASSACTARALATTEGMVYLAALGSCVSGVGEAVHAVQRIMATTSPS